MQCAAHAVDGNGFLMVFAALRIYQVLIDGRNVEVKKCLSAICIPVGVNNSAFGLADRIQCIAIRNPAKRKLRNFTGVSIPKVGVNRDGAFLYGCPPGSKIVGIRIGDK